MSGPILYLVSRYPLVSQTFIRREVDALRELGVAVAVASIHATPPEQLFGRDEQEAARATWPVLGRGRARLVREHLAELLARPGPYVATLRAALGYGRGLRGTLWQLFYFLEAIALLRHCRSIGAHHLHVHFANNAADVARLAVTAGRTAEPDAHWRWSFTMHGPTELFDVQQFGLPGKVADADYVVCISDFARSQLMAFAPVEQWAKLHVVRCGVPTGEPMTLPEGTARGSGLALLCVGRLVPEKGQHVLLEAVAALRERGHDASVTLVGQGPTADALARQAERLGLDGHVRLLGAVAPEDVRALYDEHDAFCLSSFAEGVPIVLMEAMASGLPVVSTRIAGIPELIESGVSGLLVRPGSVADLVDALDRLRDPAERRRLATGARAAVAVSYDLHRNVAALAALHRQA